VPPDADIVAIEVFDVVHPPSGVASLSVVHVPLHIANVPVIGAGTGFTVTVIVCIQPEPSI
jgi:hypothetical protein